MSSCAVHGCLFLDVFKRTVSRMGSGVGDVGNITLWAARCGVAQYDFIVTVWTLRVQPGRHWNRPRCRTALMVWTRAGDVPQGKRQAVPDGVGHGAVAVSLWKLRPAQVHLPLLTMVIVRVSCPSRTFSLGPLFGRSIPSSRVMMILPRSCP